ncbi:hypothetical protein ZTR_05772 [Talaromyces verruculosus]|nr:hypothetical protein ZTR_05772 [Talaromyces verruculosus]
MQHQKLAALFGCIAGIAQAAPSPATAATTGFSSECSDVTLNTNWLVANCLNDAGTSVSSGVYLPSHVTNTEDPKDANNLLLMFTSGKRKEYIANHNGHLLSSLEGTPIVPSDASLAVPSNVVLTLSAYAGPDTCPSTPGGILEFAGPETCWDLNVAVDPVVWTELMATSNEGWSVSVYNVSTCTGTPLVTFDQHSVNECITVGKNGGAYLSFTPLWNYD